MVPKLKISEFLLKRLEGINQQCSGCLFGVFYGESTLLLMGFNVESTIGQFNYEQIQYKFPAELDLCGLVKFGDCSDAEAHLSEIFKDVDITDNPILLHCQLGTLVGLRASIFMHGKLLEIPYEQMDCEELYRDFCFTRLKCSLNLYIELSSESLRKEMHSLRKTLSCGSLAFHIKGTPIYINNTGTHATDMFINDDKRSNISSESFVYDVVRTACDQISESNKIKFEVNSSKKKEVKHSKYFLSSVWGAVGCFYDILNIDVLRCKTRERFALDESRVLPSVNLCIQHGIYEVCVPLEVEAMAILCKNTKLNRLYDILIESICRSLRLFEHSMLEKLEANDNSPIMQPRSYHFFPQEFGHFLTCSYLDGILDEEKGMQEKRKQLHRHFGLPTSRPYFRRSNQCVFRNEMSINMPLLNPHNGLHNKGSSKESLVQGNYYYYHYLQQEIQDKGWGCAYRSLQTLCSWFQLQGYTERAVPSHYEIQEYLVRIGDKPSNFIGSSQWIGSTEVSMCLQGFINVDSKIKHVPSGNELFAIASELAVHFQTQGTPVMIGGGVLAHTIIGINFSTEPEETKFLILDPHYTGQDELHIVQSKGWCGWKGLDFWNQNSYYNLCMPQRPIMF